MSHRFSYYLRIGGATLVVIAPFVLLFIDNQDKCSSILNGAHQSNCDEDLASICPNPAVGVLIRSNIGLQYDIVCSWAKDTRAVAIISLVLSIMALVLYSCQIRRLKGTKVVLYAGVVALVALGTTFVMMLADIMRGKGTVAEDYSQFQGGKIFRHQAFVSNCSLMFGACAAMFTLVVHSYEEYCNKGKNE